MAEKITLKSFPKNEENPFLKKDDLIIKVPQKYKREVYKANGRSNEDTIIISSTTGEIDGEIKQVFIKEHVVDTEKFVKFYTENLKLFFNLNNSSIKVLSYLFNTLPINKDLIIFDMEECVKFTNLTIQSIYTSLTSLINYKFIARSKYTNMYYINPTIFFNGDRVAFIKTFRKKKAEEYNKLQNQIPFELESASDEQPASEIS